MKNISGMLKKRLAQKNMSKLSIGAFLVHHGKGYLQFPADAGGYIRNNILFLKVDHREDKAWLFIKKITMMRELNQRLVDLWYTYVVRDIRLK